MTTILSKSSGDYGDAQHTHRQLQSFPGSLFKAGLTRASRLWRATPLFNWQIRPRQLTGMMPVVHDLWRGDAKAGRMLIQEMTPPEYYAERWHDFSWLRDLREYGGTEARKTARLWTENWIRLEPRYNPNTWQPALTGRRLTTWISCWSWFAEPASQPQQALMLASMQKQWKCLHLDWAKPTRPEQRISALTGLFYAEATIGKMLAGKMFQGKTMPPETNSHKPSITRQGSQQQGNDADLGDALNNDDLRQAPAKEIFKSGDRLGTAINAVEPLIRQLVLDDGCHVSRRPDEHFQLMRMLAELRYALGLLAEANHSNLQLQDDTAAGSIFSPPPDEELSQPHSVYTDEARAGGKRWSTHALMIASVCEKLEQTLAAQAAIARAWRFGNGKLARFNAAEQTENAPTLTEREEILAKCSFWQGGSGKTAARGFRTGGRITSHARSGGFMRLSSGRNTAIMDCAPAPEAAALMRQNRMPRFAGVMALEFASGNQRIFTQCGQPDSITAAKNPDLAVAMAGSAAHSCLMIDDYNASTVNLAGRDRQEARIATMIEAELGPASGGMLAMASHDGFEKSHGIIHQRQVFLATGGQKLIGEDCLVYTGGPGKIPTSAFIRFHLHPRVSARLLRNGKLLLRAQKPTQKQIQRGMPNSSSTKSIMAWQFSAEGGEMSLCESIYFPATEQRLAADRELQQELFSPQDSQHPEGQDRLSRHAASSSRPFMRTSHILLTVPISDIRSRGRIIIRWGLKRP